MIIGNRFQPNAAGFIEEYSKLNGKIDGIICLQVKQDLKFYIKRSLRFVKLFKPSAIKKIFLKIICKLGGLQEMETLKLSWNTSGENSWDLLEKKPDIFEYAAKNNIPMDFAIGISRSLIEKQCKEETVFLLYGGGILTKELLEIKNAEFINAHMGKMPTYRGMNVIEWAVLEENKPMVSVMTMNEQIDGGDVIYEKEIQLGSEKTIAALRKTGFIYCYKAMAEGVYKYSKGEIKRIPQPKGAKYYYRMHSQIRKMLSQKLLSTQS